MPPSPNPPHAGPTTSLTPYRSSPLRLPCARYTCHVFFRSSGRIPPPQTALAGSLQQQHSRNRGLRPLKKSISEAGGLGSYLEGASSAHVSAIAAAEISRAAVAGALDTIWGCLEVQPSPRVQQPPPPPLSPSYSYVRPKALSLWGGVQLTE